MAESKVVHASIPAAVAVLFRAVITLVGNLESNWDDIIAPMLVLDDKGKPDFDKELKSVGAANFRNIYIEEKAPDAIEGTDDYKDVAKDATAMWGMGTKRALVRAQRAAGFEPVAAKRGAKAAATATEGGTSQNPADPAKTPELPPSIVARISDAMSRAGNLQTAFIKFQSAHKLPKAATEACGNMAEDIGKLFTELTTLHAELNK